MRNILFFLLLAFVVFLQTSLLRDVEVFGIVPNVSLVLFFVISFWIQDFKRVFASALFLGVLLDLFSGFSFGIFTLTFIFLAFFLNLLLGVFISRESVLVLFFMVIIGTFAYYFLTLTLTNIFNFFDPKYFSIKLDIVFLKTIFVESLYNSVILFLLLPLKRFI
jgi:rod shape-determining protein MreD